METSTEKIIAKLKGLGCPTEILEHDPVITIDDVVRILNIPVKKMAKTVLLNQKETGLIAAVLPGMGKVDFVKIANILKVPKSSVQIANRATMKDLGINPGDVCPFHDFLQKVIVDTDLLKQEKVYCGSGDPRKTIVIDPKEMVKAIGATIADISQTTSVNNQTEGGSDE